MSRTFNCRIYAVPKESYRQDQRDFICAVPVTAYFAGNKVIKFESDSTLPYIGLVLSDLLNQYIGKHISKNTDTLVATVPAAAIAAHKKPATLQVGAYYKRRDGRVVGPVQVNRSVQWPYIVKPLGEAPRTYTAEGRTDPYKCDSKYDLIEFYGFESEIAAAEPKPLKLEAGKWYKTRRGDVVKVSNNAFSYYWKGRGFIFQMQLPEHGYVSLKPDGSCTTNGEEHECDLIEEVAAPATQPQVDAATDVRTGARIAFSAEQRQRMLDAARHALANPLGHSATTDSPSEPHREISAPEFLNTAARIMEERGRQYDQEGGERSMGKCVAAFNAITGRDLTESEGWLLMAVLKQVRLFQKPGFHKDSAEDGIAYTALLAEAKQREVA